MSAMIQDALRAARRQRLRGEWKSAQGYWSARAREKGLLKEEDLDRFIRRDRRSRHFTDYPRRSAFRLIALADYIKEAGRRR